MINIRENKFIKFFEEQGFLLAIFLLASMYTLRFSNLDLIPAFKYVFMAMRLISYGLVAIKFIIDLINQKYKGYYLPVLIIGLYMAFIAYNSRTINYFVYFVYVVVGKDVDYTKIIKAAFYGILVSIIIVFILFATNFIEDDITIQSGGTRIRHSLGFRYAAFLANYCLYGTLYYIYIRKNRIKLYEIILLLVINILCFKITDTKNAFIFGVIAVLITLIIKYVPYFRIYKKIYTIGIYIASIVLPVFIVILTYLYDNSSAFLVKLNQIVTGRLRLGHDAIVQYGIKLFGQYIKFSSDSSTGIEYNIVDSAYVLYLLILGSVFFVLMILLFLYFGRLIDKKKDVYLAYIFVILLCHSTFDAQIFQLSNSYIMFILSYKNELVEYNE